MQVLHSVGAGTAVFDEPNLVSCAGLAPVLALAERAGLARLAGRHVRVPGEAGANPQLKVPALVAGMVAGADSIDDLDLLRHGGMTRLFSGVRAPSTLGIFLRGFTFGHVRQLDAVAARFLAALARQAPILPACRISYLDLDDTMRETHGYAKQGVGYGHTGVKGLNALLATISSPAAAPLICAARLRRGGASSVRGAARLIADGLAAARPLTGEATVVVRADSAFWGFPVVAAIRRGGARFSLTARMTAPVRRAIGTIDQTTWTPIRYPRAIWEEDEQRWISDAEVAEIPFTAFTTIRPEAQQVTARLIVRRVRRLNPHAAAGQDELFSSYRYHAVFTDSPLPMLEAEAAHRGHAIIEQVHADLKNGPLTHLPSGRFAANAAWLVLACIAFNLTRAAGCLASPRHAKAATATLRRHLINLPARLARSARRLILHLPQQWPWRKAVEQLFAHTCGPPRPATT
jgi:Transposase DDE domain group 1